jgi:hypothetical protein
LRLDLSIGEEHLRVIAPRQVLVSLRQRYGAFESSAPPLPGSGAPIVLEIRCRPGRFAPAYEHPVPVTAHLTGPDELVFAGELAGRYSLADRRGSIEATGLGAVDALIRAALSVSLPLAGAVLLHGAALRNEAGDGVALCGDSRSGKSTAAVALGGFCDELIVLRPSEAGVELLSTPYWAGRPLRCHCAAVIGLERGAAAPGLGRLRGASIARMLLRHIIRYVAIERVDRAILHSVGAIAERAEVAIASCPEGKAFVPFLRERIGLRRVA